MAVPVGAFTRVNRGCAKPVEIDIEKHQSIIFPLPILASVAYEEVSEGTYFSENENCRSFLFFDLASFEGAIWGPLPKPHML